MNGATREIPLLLEDTIAFCHPDRHPERADKANRLTRELLALRRAQRQKSNGTDGDKVPLWVTARTIHASGVVVAAPAHLLSIRINSRVEGSSLTLYDALVATNPSTGELKPNVETRYLHTTRRTAIRAEIRGAMSVTLFFIKGD
jgi:hypothetical protein